MNEMERYYEEYHKEKGANAYTMGRVKDTSRVLTLISWIKEYAKPGDRILDVGCGDMYLASQLPEYQWTGIDLTTEPSQGKAIKHDLAVTPYPFPEGSFELVVCSEVLEHCWDIVKIQKEVARLIKKNGTYLLSTPNFDWMDHHISSFRQLLFDPVKPHLYEHIRQYNFPVHAKFLDQAGFDIVTKTGADAHYGDFFAGPRRVLSTILNQSFDIYLDGGQVDQILGEMFPLCSHTIMIVARRRNE